MDKIEIIKPDALVSIQLSSPYIKRLHDLSIYFSNIVSPEELAKQIENIRDEKELSEFGTHFETMLILLGEVETKAKEQNLTEFIPVPVQEMEK